MDSLNDQWKRARQDLGQHATPAAALAMERKAKKSVLSFQYANIAILSVLLVVLILFFYFLTPFKTILSWVGVGLMTGGIFVRILVEIFSARRYARIHVEADTISATNESMAFHLLRKKIHGPVTITIVALYIIGFYMLSPEFSLYFSLTWMLIMDVGFAIGAVILATQIKKGIRQELETLKALTELRNNIESGE